MFEVLLLFAFLMFLFGLGFGYMIFGRDAKEFHKEYHDQKDIEMLP